MEGDEYRSADLTPAWLRHGPNVRSKPALEMLAMVKAWPLMTAHQTPAQPLQLLRQLHLPRLAFQPH